MHPKRKTSNEKTAQFFTLASKALRRIINHIEGFDTTELLPEHKKDVQSFIELQKHWTNQQAQSADNAAEHYKSNIENQ